MLDRNVRVQVLNDDQSREVQNMVLNAGGRWNDRTKDILYMGRKYPCWIFISVDRRDGPAMGINDNPNKFIGFDEEIDLSQLRIELMGETEGLFSNE